jgi:mono/diheme cytochrome c family protein
MDDEPIEEESPMPRRPLLITLVSALAVLILVVVGIVYASEQAFHRTYEVPLPTLSIPVPVGDSQAIAEGERLGVVRGCVGCHTAGLNGKIAFNVPGLYTLPSANLTTGHGGVGSYSDGYLARAIRLGVKHNDEGVYGMPSATFHTLDDTDLALILAWVRSKAALPTSLPPRSLGWKGRIQILLGSLHSVADSLPDVPKPPKAPPYGPTLEYGEYLARTICAECHGARLEGTDAAPGLSVIAAYDSVQFVNAIVYGEARDGRLLKRSMPIERYDALLPEERTALYLYLHSLRGPANW